jgi:hypothetical protein
MLTLTLTDEEKSILSFSLTCRLDDYEKEIKQEEKRQGKPLPEARAHHSALARLIYIKIIPDALCGPWKLMDGTTISPTKR